MAVHKFGMLLEVEGTVIEHHLRDKFFRAKF
jgi:hypothetical protein